MSHFEIEIKTLLGEEEKALNLKSRMMELDPACVCTSKNKQLNHYFHEGDIHELYKQTEHLFTGEQHKKFKTITERGREFSIRTRQRDDEVLLVIKASIDEGTSANTIKRMEFEESVAIGLDELDELLKAAGYTYLSKWSREREEYEYKGSSVCIDKNGGYGFLAEFEKIIQSETEVPGVRSELKRLMAELEVEELDQGRLARMFEFYNKNWPDYYGNNNTFVIE